MSKRFFALAFATGLAAVAWVGYGFAGSNWLALAMTVAIGAVYLLGAFELRQFRAANAGLAAALADIPQPLADLGDWLDRVPATLRHAVRLRVQGERAGLPGPALTPYLVGLLVMLGMLGTFLGMVVTFKGAVFALERSGDLQGMRSALAEPIKGLGLAFGTSVAGVAASALLGLMSAISRRERLELGRELDQRIAGALRPFSMAHQREEALHALQLQAGALPRVADQLQGMMERIERRSQQLDEQLLERQAQFQRDAAQAYTGLADRVGASLQNSLAAGAKAAGASITPVVESAMTRVVQDAQQWHARLGEQARAQAETLAQQFGATSRDVAAAWQAALREQVRTSEASAGQLLRTIDSFAETCARHSSGVLEAEASAVELHGRRIAELTATWREQLDAVRAEMSRLAERDTQGLQERALLLENMDTLLRNVNHASGEQRAAIDALVAAASSTLERAGGQFAQAVQAQADKAADAAVHVSASAVELSSLGEAFAQSVQLFQAGNEKLLDTLQRIEAAIARSTARSDEQLAYYVAQAREVIDLSIASQHGLVENLRQIAVKPSAAAPGARG